MLGPVFTLELLRERRRGRSWRLLGWTYAFFLGFQSVMAWYEHGLSSRSTGRFVLTPAVVFAEQVERSLGQHFVVLMLLTPALTASALAEEKANGTLADLFTTALTPGDILGGKWLARSLRVAEVILPSLPILVAVATYAGVPLSCLCALLGLSLLVILGVGAVGLMWAVASKHASGALLGTYALVGGGALLVRGFPLPALDPMRTLATASGRAEPAVMARALVTASLA
ncbi:MAG TPA: hypothetical protein VFW33_16480, partial [Gemmataceae bacterium]|nr:hypothetical protein [Gemmataceae bacterium]